MSPARSTRRAYRVLRTSKEPTVVGDEQDYASADAESEDSATEMVTRLAQRMIRTDSIASLNRSSCSRSTYHDVQTKKRRRARRNELKSDFLKQSGGILKAIDAAFGDQAKQV